MMENDADHHGRQLAQTILDSLTAHIAILDEHGTVLATNRAWERFARENDMQMRPKAKDVNYLEICESACSPEDDSGSYVAAKIREVIAGRLEEFVMDYPCHSPERKRWFYMRVTRAAGPGPVRIVVSHENITELREAENRLNRNQVELQQEKKNLEEANTALKILLRQTEANRRDMEADVFNNVHRMIHPQLIRLADMNLPGQARAVIASLNKRLADVTSPFFRRLSNIKTVLTPQEIEVAALIQEGLSTKQVASRLNLSITTVNFHRQNLRRKFNLNNTSTNLQAFLSGLME